MQSLALCKLTKAFSLSFKHIYLISAVKFDKSAMHSGFQQPGAVDGTASNGAALGMGEIIATLEIEGMKGRTATFEIGPDIRHIQIVSWMHAPSDDFMHVDGKVDLLDPEGRVASLFRYGTPPEEMAAMIRQQMRG